MVHSFSLEHVNHMTAYRRRSFRVRENLHGSKRQRVGAKDASPALLSIFNANPEDLTI